MALCCEDAFAYRHADFRPDLDIFETSPGEFVVTIATAYEVYVLPIQLDSETMKPKAPIAEPVCIRSSEHPDAFEKRGGM
jgi:hypothetical protein